MFLEYTSLIIPTKDRPKSLKNLIESIEGLVSKLNEIIMDRKDFHKIACPKVKTIF